MIILLTFLIAYSLSLSLGENLIINGKFLEPDLISTAVPYLYVPWGIPGWTCTSCDLQNCAQMVLYYQPTAENYGTCKGQSLDLSSTQIEVVSQIFQATRGSYLLSIEYNIPMRYASSKTLVIYFNEKEVYRHQPQVYTDSKTYNISLDLQSRTGKNNLTFNTEGMSDYFGFRLTSVEFRRKVDPQIQSFVQSSFNNYLLIGAISFSASRIILGDLVRFFISLDRLQFYSFHNRNHSYYTNILLKNITAIMDAKATFIFKLQEKIVYKEAQKQDAFFSELDFKQAYISPALQSKSENGYGFISNNKDMFIYSLPFYVISITFFYFVFRITFDWRISKFFRKYSFYGIIFLLMLCQGNIEQYSFYAFGEMKTFFSLNYKHKLVNCVILGFFLIIFTVSIALHILLWGRYRKKTKYFVDNVELNLGGILAYSLSYGTICLLFGALHQFLLNFPNIQLLGLGIAQIVWVLIKMIFLGQRFYSAKWIVWLTIFQGLLRIVFQLTIYLYANTTDRIRTFVNEEIHLIQILLFVSVWIMQFLGSILLFIYQCLKMLSENRRVQKKDAKNQQEMTSFNRKQLFIRRNDCYYYYFQTSSKAKKSTNKKSKILKSIYHSKLPNTKKLSSNRSRKQT